MTETIRNSRNLMVRGCESSRVPVDINMTEDKVGTMPNTLYYGDNLQVLREHIPDESVDLVYLDPPFNSNASDNVLFKEKTGEESPAQIQAFTDTWEWTQETERTYELDIIQKREVPSPLNVRQA